MAFTRRQFVKQLLAYGGTLILAPSCRSTAKTVDDDWLPAYGKL